MIEVAATYVCSGCETRVFPVGTCRGEALACTCSNEDGDLTVVFEHSEEEWPDTWDWDEAELENVLGGADV